MKKAEITRQHDDTSMTEIVGEICQNFIVVHENDESDNAPYSIFYLKLSDTYHRFFTDSGLLFWNSNSEPDEEDDLFSVSGIDASYIDLGKKYDLVGSAVESITFKDDRFNKLLSNLDMRFSNGIWLRFQTTIDGGSWLVE